MPRLRQYECPECLGRFNWFHHPISEPPPNFCPLCGAQMTAEPVFVPTAPHIAKTIGKTADTVYRQMEQAGETRAQVAAEATGGDISDFAALKVSDMADYLRPGDIAAKIPDNPVSQAMRNSGQGGFQPLGGMSGADFAANTTQGAFPHAGEATRRNLVTGHAERARVIEGRMSRLR